MQPQAHPMAPMAPNSPANVTTEQIQKYLDENKQLIFAIMDNQNLGKLAECAQYQAQLQKNLLYLAAIADAQPPTSTIRPQMVPHPPMQQGNPLTPAFHPRPPLQFSSQPINEQQQHQPRQMFPGHMGMRPGPSMPSMHLQPSHVGSSELPPDSSTGGGNKHDVGKLIAANTPGTCATLLVRRVQALSMAAGKQLNPPAYRKIAEDSIMM